MNKPDFKIHHAYRVAQKAGTVVNCLRKPIWYVSRRTIGHVNHWIWPMEFSTNRHRLTPKCGAAAAAAKILVMLSVVGGYVPPK